MKAAGEMHFPWPLVWSWPSSIGPATFKKSACVLLAIRHVLYSLKQTNRRLKAFAKVFATVLLITAVSGTYCMLNTVKVH